MNKSKRKPKQSEYVVEYEGRSFTSDQLLRNKINSRLNKWMASELMLSMKENHEDTYNSLYVKFKAHITKEAEKEFNAAKKSEQESDK